MTYKAWNSGRPVYSRLPDTYLEDGVSDALTFYWDELLVETKSKVDNFGLQLDPLTCDAKYLDYLSLMLGWIDVWDVTWSEQAKRTLLDNSYRNIGIWINKGSARVLSFILDTLGVEHFIQIGTSFLVGYSRVGDPIGTVAWDFDIIMRTRSKDSDSAKLAARIKDLFAPVWCRSSIIFDDTRFSSAYYYVLSFNDDFVLATDEDKALEIK
ncbi:MAG: phage tail protein [Myxacorys californica WJT36-NPBG1]|jgi:hypothetical protein|nr:phage tail protein [Myxacorys californica WJT36-NPBG1]